MVVEYLTEIANAWESLAGKEKFIYALTAHNVALAVCVGYDYVGIQRDLITARRTSHEDQKICKKDIVLMPRTTQGRSPCGKGRETERIRNLEKYFARA